LIGGELRWAHRLRKFRLRENVGLRRRAVLVGAVAVATRSSAAAAALRPAILRGSIVVLQRSRSLAEGASVSVWIDR
jgi:hypothetical protein